MMFLLWMFIPILLLLILLQLVSKLISEKKMQNYREESSPFECGFEMSQEIRIPFSIGYYMLTLIFLLFDLEIIFLIFMVYSFMSININFMMFIFMNFLLILTLGLMYEWYLGNLDWNL